MAMTETERRELTEHHVACWNRDHPVGSVVWYYTTVYGPVHETTVSQPAEINDRGEPVAFLAGIPGDVPMLKVKPAIEWKRNSVNPVDFGDQPSSMVAQADRLMNHAWHKIKQWRNLMFAGHGNRAHLKQAADALRGATNCAEAAYHELGETEGP